MFVARRDLGVWYTKSRSFLLHGTVPELWGFGFGFLGREKGWMNHGWSTTPPLPCRLEKQDNTEIRSPERLLEPREWEIDILVACRKPGIW